jgi:F1F0 ATPase subunit 2
MQMNDLFFILLALLAGVILGWFFFYGLRYTVERLPKVKHPWLLMLSSYIIRTLIVVVAFYFVMQGDLIRLLACLVGFILARTILIKRVEKQSQV